MKKILIACLSLVTMLTSCSDDDSSSTGSSSPLVSSKQTLYENGQIAETIVTEYSNGKITKSEYFTPDNEQIGYEIISYDSNGLLTAVNSYFGGVIYATNEYSYDNQGRMISMHHQSEMEGSDYTRTFTHNTDNTITSTSTNSWEQPKTFYINSNGIAYKEVIGSSINEFTLDGATVVSASYNGYVTTYEYDQEHDPSLIDINMGTGNFKPNNTLRLNGLSTNNGDKYMTKIINGADIFKYVYTFNELGLPTKYMAYSNEVLQSQMEYFYN